MPHIYALIIGTEILNGRRVDKHFEFLKQELLKRGLELHASFVVKDDEKLMEDIFSLIKKDENAIMFCFGGIGATPDDLTREISAKVFTCKDLVLHERAKEIIEDEFGKDAYPYRINMAKLPNGSKLLTNVVNRVPGYFLENRLFFMPGFPKMAHPMVVEALEKYIHVEKKEFFSFLARVESRESDLVGFMQELPKEIELSSLPRMEDGNYSVEFMLRSTDKTLVELWSEKFISMLQSKNIQYKKL